VPNFEKLEKYARSSNIPFASRADLIANEQVVNFLKAEVDRATPNLAQYERIKRIALLAADLRWKREKSRPRSRLDGTSSKRNIEA